LKFKTPLPVGHWQKPKAQRAAHLEKNMQTNATASSATKAQGIPLSDGQTIDDEEFNQHLARMPGGNTASCGPSAAAMWFDFETTRN
jgi:hypothetical protein